MSKQERRVAQLPDRLKPAAVLAQRGQPGFAEVTSEAEHTLKRIELQERREAEKRQEGWSKWAGRPVQHRRYSRR